jgi:hypothetical protein
MRGLTDHADRRWLLPIPTLLLIAQIVYVVNATSPLVGLLEVAAGVYAVAARRLLTLSLLSWQHRAWRFPFGAREVQLGTLIVTCASLGLVLAGGWSLLDH